MSLRGDDEIDSLLALMGGGEDAMPSSQGVAIDSRQSEEPTKRKKKKAKKDKRSKTVKSSRDLFLESRLDRNCSRWPQSRGGKRLLTLGSGLAHSCTGYITPEDADGYGSVKCSACGKSSSAHELCISIDDQQCKDTKQTDLITLVSIFVAARNVRCILGEYYASIVKTSASKVKATLLSPSKSIQSSPSLISTRLDMFQGRVFSELRKLCVPNNSDLAILKEKSQSMMKAVHGYKNAIATNGSGIHAINFRLEAMASCDMLYYRCYYTCITTLNSENGETVDMMLLIPHPPTYFSCPGLAWDVLESGNEALNIFLEGSDQGASMRDTPLDKKTKSMLMNSWDLKSRLDKTGVASVNNPLLSLWQSRFVETLRHIWATGYSARVTPGALDPPDTKTVDRASVQQDVMELPQNNTIAISSSVALWRDSIRDYPANFYSYACPTKHSLEVITSCMKKKAGIEAGAGTGYWSALINAKESIVMPYDIAPPSKATPNSYHGEIPSFTNVKNANSFDQSKMKSFHESASTLLLCYPPPASDMALSSLSTHMQHGGKTVVHVGEWQGLTGNAAFEHMLTENFICVHHELLPLWGTDATYLTIWKDKNEVKEKTEHSAAFGYCSAQLCCNAAERRCKFARCLQYCSQTCYERHASSRRSYLALHMVQLPSDEDIGFNNDNHFAQLLSEESQQRPKKKRKKNKIK